MGLKNEDTQEAKRAERQTTQTSMGDAVSEIPMFPTVALCSINP